MNFQELGLTLQREREKKGLSIAAAMEATKISRINIEALEKGDSSALPHPVYTKGFVKSYARFLGLDADDFSMVVDKEYQVQEESEDEASFDVAPVAEKAFQDTDSRPEKKRSIWPVILILLSLVVGAVVLFIVFSGDDDKSNSEIVEPAPSVENLAPTETPAPAIESSPVESGQDQSVVEEESSVESAEGEAPLEETVTPATPEKKADAVPAKPKAPEKQAEKPVKSVAEKTDKPQKPQYDHVLVIRAISEKGCWIGVWRGNETAMARDFVLKQGEPLRLMFNNPRRVRIGNVSGVTVLYNGKPYKLNKGKGNIQTLKFGMN